MRTFVRTYTGKEVDLGDVVSPLKQLLPEYKKIEQGG